MNIKPLNSVKKLYVYKKEHFDIIQFKQISYLSTISDISKLHVKHETRKHIHAQM